MAKSIKKPLNDRSAYRQTGPVEEAGKLPETKSKQGSRKKGEVRVFQGSTKQAFGIVYQIGGKVPSQGKGKSAREAGTASPRRAHKPFEHDVFTSEAEYNQSVESVVARIRSGEVKARTPDE